MDGAAPLNPYEQLRRRRLFIRVVLGGLLLAAIWRAWVSTPVPSEEGNAIDAIVSRAMEREAIAGIAVGVMQGGEVVHSAGYGYADLENALPVNAETVFNIGSITKQFAAAALLLLVEEGEIEVDAPLARYLPEYGGWGDEVTVRSLLQHTSGVRNFTSMESWWRTVGMEVTPAETAAHFRNEPLDFPPGTEFSYSNSGYILLGILLERIEGRPLGAILRERLFLPLRLERTSYCDDHALIPNRARGYEVIEGELQNATHVSISHAYAAGGLCSNVEDLLRWSRLLARGGVVKSEAYRQMTSPGKLRDGTEIEYGFGLAIGYRNGHRRIGHVGGMRGFSSHLANYPDDDLTIVVLTNTEGAAAANLEGEIARWILGVEEVEGAEVPITPAELARYAGEYTTHLTSVTFSVREGRLHAATPDPGLDDLFLTHVGSGVFQGHANPEIQVHFEEGGGEVVGFRLEYQGIQVKGERKS